MYKITKFFGIILFFFTLNITNCFAASYALTVTTTGNGHGSVSYSSPVGTSCGVPLTCKNNYAGTKVTLTANPSTGTTFTGWGGACSGTATCVVTVSAAKSVTANFNLNLTPTTPTTPSGNCVFENLSSKLSKTMSWVYDSRTGLYTGTLTMINSQGQTIYFKNPIWYEVTPDAYFWLYLAAGLNGYSGHEYADLTTYKNIAGTTYFNQLAVMGNGDAVINSGESVSLTGIKMMGRRDPAVYLAGDAIWGYSCVSPTVTFDSQNPTIPASPATIMVPSSATNVGTLPSSPVKTGYTFRGWYTGAGGTGSQFTAATTVTSNITVYAYWTINTYVVTYNPSANGSIVGTAIQTINYGANSVAVTPVPTIGYHFVNWSDGSIANPRQDNFVINNITVTANFAINTYTVIFDSQSATTPASPTSKTVIYNSSVVTLPTAPTKTSYIFGGWYTAINGGGTAFLATTPVTVNITVYAKWIAVVPLTPTGFWVGASNCGNNWINLSWNASAGVTSYDVYRSGSLLLSTTSLAFSDVGLTPGQSYSYYVIAKNSGGSSVSTATLSATVCMNIYCGSANGMTVDSAPTTNLCSDGSKPQVSGSGPWNWTCVASGTVNPFIKDLISMWTFDKADGSSTTTLKDILRINDGSPIKVEQIASPIKGEAYHFPSIPSGCDPCNQSDVSAVDIVNEQNFDFINGQSITISSFFKLDNVTDPNMVIISKSSHQFNSVTPVATNYQISANKNQIVFLQTHYQFGDYVTFSEVYSTPINITTETWHHVAVTYTFGVANTMKVYLDGNLIPGGWTPYTYYTNPWGGYTLVTGGNGNADAYFVNNGPLRFGWHPDGGTKGSIDEVSIWNRALSIEEIKNLFDSYTGTPGLSFVKSCSANILSNASCSVSPATVIAGQTVTWTATPPVLPGPFTYSWTGTNLTGRTTQIVTTSYSSPGTYYASTTVGNGVSTSTVGCKNGANSGIVVVEPTINGTCVVGSYFSAPSAPYLCLTGMPSSVSGGVSGPWSWTCTGSGPSNTGVIPCTANKANPLDSNLTCSVTSASSTININTNNTLTVGPALPNTIPINSSTPVRWTFNGVSTTTNNGPIFNKIFPTTGLKRISAEIASTTAPVGTVFGPPCFTTMTAVQGSSIREQ